MAVQREDKQISVRPFSSDLLGLPQKPRLLPSASVLALYKPHQQESAAACCAPVFLRISQTRSFNRQGGQQSECLQPITLPLFQVQTLIRNQ